MIQLTPQMRILVAVEPADFRKGIDGLCQLCRQALGADPFSGGVFVFRNRLGTAIKLIVYDLCEAPRYVEWRREAPGRGLIPRVQPHITRTGFRNPIRAPRATPGSTRRVSTLAVCRHFRRADQPGRAQLALS